MKSKMFASGGLIALGAVGMWLSSRMSWLTVETFDDKSGAAANGIVGAVWAPEIQSIGLALIAGVVATLILGKLGRRVVGVLSAVLAVVASWSPMMLLSGGEEGVDKQRALDLLTSGSASQRANAPVTVADWAQVEAVHIHSAGPALTLLCCAVALLGAVVMIRRPGEVKKQKSSAYETPEVRRERIAEDLESDPQSGRVLWDALDAGVDPTDLDENAAGSDKARTRDVKGK
ncbi:TIGR02234 family membrane protein [Corynebacterium lactis]|uniref:Membrane protein n=1 Tax=Corynebacterium lactis RW2-5 TaxID=1408189 RepID=A0A0K2H0L5_9CORY|nr:TIGR02234 family membrane protein [Corynebacterium lactis]ALA67585.1 membrane protein [Corynebacterium lactis RW2-5]